MSKRGLTLRKLVSSNLYGRYSSILSLSDLPLVLLGDNGDVLLEFNPAPDFCKHICQTDTEQACESYTDCFPTREPVRFACKHGLESILIPILVQGEIVAYLAGLQVYSEESEYQRYLFDIGALNQSTGISSDSIAKTVSLIKAVATNKIEIHEQICGHIAHNISLDLSAQHSNIDNDVERLSIEKEILEKKILDLEAKNMSLVVTPHFLFNTLNSIARIAYFEKSHTIEELIYCLSDLLRYNLKQGEQLHTIESEIDNIEKYLYIQKVRFKNRLEYIIDVDNSIRPYRIPNMVLQPIVENALIHGITPKRDGGKIHIYAEKYRDNITISVMDNGNGFPQKVLEMLEHPNGTGGVGFRSTDRRLKRYFGEQYGLKIVRSDYTGSTVAIRIPCQQNVR